jgi:hypothetical protein
MNLQETMSEMAHRELTLEEAKDFCNDQFGRVATYLREQYAKDKAIITWQIEDVKSLDENLTDEEAITILKSFEGCCDGSMEQMWYDLQFHVDEFKKEAVK